MYKSKIMKTKTKFKIQGMHCQSCAKSVEFALMDQIGVDKASADFGSKDLNVEYDESVIGPEQMAKAVSELGYELVLQ